MTALLAIAIVSQATLVPDMGYEPKMGDVVRVYRRESGRLLAAPAVVEEAAFPVLVKTVQAKEQPPQDVVMLDPGTQIKVIDVSTIGVYLTYRIAKGGIRIPEHYQDPLHRWYKVRVLEGDANGKTLYLNKDWAKRCAIVPAKGKAKARPTEPAKK